MLIRTHLAVTVLFILIFISYVNDKLSFVLVALIATFLPDVDVKSSKIGKKKVFRILQFFTKHRGIIHSFTFLFFITLFLVCFFPVIALPFFLGYSLHLLADSFTVEGIKPFYPLRKSSFGIIKTGSRGEVFVFVIFILADLGLVVYKFGEIF